MSPHLILTIPVGVGSEPSVTLKMTQVGSHRGRSSLQLRASGHEPHGLSNDSELVCPRRISSPLGSHSRHFLTTYYLASLVLRAWPMWTLVLHRSSRTFYKVTECLRVLPHTHFTAEETEAYKV